MAKTKTKAKPEREEEDDILIEDEDEAVVSLDTIKKNFLKKAKETGSVNTADLVDATSHLDLSEEDFEGLLDYFRSNKIEIEDDEVDESDEELALEGPEGMEDVEREMEEDEADAALDDVNLSEDEKEVASITDFSHIPLGEVKVNDSVKMYLKEIGKVNLLSAKEETESSPAASPTPPPRKSKTARKPRTSS